ncbi:maleylacetoacetate isomerase-like isoform X2 [Gigantopelta aegis]|nr:maleylacetoacetate isomerase-like isoform X2 [Gigantopelta aegis]XP_041353265.1 maleylacetoacetate isomerase-like isoform X2 [Gigantopelta aegis]XP_041353266.1 maleylacetoacetate isomerase-like isoform X2 [Gigantopelta aegis]
MTSKPVLYSYYRSSASYRVRIALQVKGIDYEYKAVSLIKDGGEQYKEEYKKLNPMGQVPTLVIDGHTLVQSLPIIEYLDETRPSPRLLPEDPAGRVKVRSLAEIVNSGIQPLQNLPVLKKVGDDQKLEWAKYWIERGFKALETSLQETAGKYSFKDEVTMADLCLVPQVYNALRFGIDMSEFPTIHKVYDALVTLEAFKAAHPSNQPDTPADQKP